MKVQPAETGAKSGDLVFVGDVHLVRDDPDLEAFLQFLDSLLPTVRRLVFLGDLFNLWIGRREMEQSHHRAVAGKLEAMRRRGVVVRYVEGNRDFRVGGLYAGSALDDATDRGISERFGDLRVIAVHGDLANVRDRQYRTWRRLSRSRLFWAAFNVLPARPRLRLAESLETRMRRSNLGYKLEFPEDEVRDYAAGLLGEGHEAVVLGHFHVEKDLEARPPSPPGRILVLPEWKGSRRYLRVTRTGEIAFESSTGGS